MSFGKNPHVAKAEAAEQKAMVARDASAYEQAWLEAGRQWERAAEREQDGKRRSSYAAKAEAARANADSPPPEPTVTTGAAMEPALGDSQEMPARPSDRSLN